jgi:predicted NBD/HSP70 family sugar kinase
MAVPTARERNALRVLDYLFREGPARRVDVIRATALSRATVSKLIGELQAQGLVVEQRPALNVAGRSGRPPTRLTLNPQIGAFGGVDFGHSSVRVAIADVTGALVAEDRLDLDVDNAAELAITAAVERLPALVAQAGLARKRLLGVGAAISAPVRRDGASVVTAGILPGWSAVSPQRELARRLGVPVHVGNDANLGALAEVRTGAAAGATNVLYVMLSSGVGGGLVLHGSLFTGHSGMTGELGHVQVDPEVAGDIANVVNPELVIVGGDLIIAGELLVDAVREGLEQTSIPAVRADLAVVAATLGDRAELLGAIGLAIEQADIAAVVGSA